MKKIFIAAVILFTITCNAHAERPKYYVGFGPSYFNYSEDDFEHEFSQVGFTGYLGHHLNDNFSVESRLGMGIVSKNVTEGNTVGSIELDHMIGVYGKGIFNISDKLDGYFLLGYSIINYTAKARNYYRSVEISDTETGMSYGAGFMFNVDDWRYFNFEYINYLDKNDYKYEGIGASLCFRF